VRCNNCTTDGLLVGDLNHTLTFTAIHFFCFAASTFIVISKCSLPLLLPLFILNLTAVILANTLFQN